MLKFIKRLFFTLVILTTLTVVILYSYNNGRTYLNDDNTIGNTIGNIYNGGLFSENDNLIFFSNDMDDGALYVMSSTGTNVRKVHNDRAVYINVDDNYIYYVRANNTRENNHGPIMFNNTGVFRINKNGSGIMSFTGKPGANLILKGNNVYFQRYDIGTGINLYKYQIDGKLERFLVKNAIPAQITDSKLYYVDYSDDNNINAINLKSFTTHNAFEGTFHYPIYKNEQIYYINVADNYKIYRMNLDGSGQELLVDYPCYTYNITNSGTYLYYQVDDNTNNGIYRLNLNTMESSSLLLGDYKQINVTENFVFFKDYDNTNTYVVLADGIDEVNIFDPSAAVSKPTSR